MSSQRIFDANLALAASHAATASENGTPLTSFYPDKIDEACVAVFDVTAVSGTTPTCAFSIQASNDGGSTWVTIGQINTINAIGRYEVAWSQLGASALCPGADRVRHVATIAGTTPSFTFQAFLAKIP